MDKKNTIVLSSADGTKYEVDIDKAKELGVIAKYVKEPWFPFCKQPYIFLNENLIPKECVDNMRGNNLARRFRSNMYINVDDALKAAEYYRGDINSFILKFAIENECLVEVNDLATSEKFGILYDVDKKIYDYSPLTNDTILTAPMLNDEEKAEKLVELLNNKSMGFLNVDNFIEKEKVVYIG